MFGPLAVVLFFAHRYAARVNFTTIATAEADLTRTHAFRNPHEAEQVGVRLELP